MGTARESLLGCPCERCNNHYTFEMFADDASVAQTSRLRVIYSKFNDRPRNCNLCLASSSAASEPSYCRKSVRK